MTKFAPTVIRASGPPTASPGAPLATLSRRPDHTPLVRLSLACDVIDLLLRERKAELAARWNAQARNFARLVWR